MKIHYIDIFLVCFSVASPESFANVVKKWVPEIKEHCPDVPYILVATKTDLRNDPDVIQKLDKVGKKPISYQEVIYQRIFLEFSNFFHRKF